MGVPTAIPVLGLALLMLLTVSIPGHAAPLHPSSDAQVLETLPASRGERAEPGNAALADALARR